MLMGRLKRRLETRRMLLFDGKNNQLVKYGVALEEAPRNPKFIVHLVFRLKK